ncbi:cadmium-containing carbonic anhydrase [Candidatus Amarolinea aalborgensis]|uniref:cadmium-containing carbonic anhydrase n=1 Tax=Candidatus Amarolinea aalborgensis TaxID=2249329 RepID=UPI003BF994BF
MKILPSPTPQSFQITNEYVWLPDLYELPAQISFDVTCGNQNDQFLPCFSFTKAEWESPQCDALSWYASPHRNDFTFRTKLFRDFPSVQRISPAWCPAVGAKFHVQCIITTTSATYYIAGKEYATATYRYGDVPERGYFGFATYGGENITVENVSPVSLDPVSFLKAKFPGVYNDLLAQQWVIRAGDNDELKDVKPGGAVHCVDGRQYTDASQPNIMLGPKIQGGVLGVVALAGDITSGNVEGIKKAVKKIQAAGYIASVHGDEHSAHAGHAANGCGFAAKWYASALTSPLLKKMELSPDEARAIVTNKDVGGTYIELKGDHVEKRVRLNFVAGKTFEPDGTAFNLDVWFAAKMGIDAETLMRNAAQTVFILVGLKPIEIFV